MTTSEVVHSLVVHSLVVHSLVVRTDGSWRIYVEGQNTEDSVYGPAGTMPDWLGAIFTAAKIAGATHDYRIPNPHLNRTVVWFVLDEENNLVRFD